jgi:hypothetical protein
MTLSRREKGHKAKMFVLLSVLPSDDGVPQPFDRQSTEGTETHWQPRYPRGTITQASVNYVSLTTCRKA